MLNGKSSAARSSGFSQTWYWKWLGIYYNHTLFSIPQRGYRGVPMGRLPHLIFGIFLSEITILCAFFEGFPLIKKEKAPHLELIPVSAPGAALFFPLKPLTIHPGLLGLRFWHNVDGLKMNFGHIYCKQQIEAVFLFILMIGIAMN